MVHTNTVYSNYDQGGFPKILIFMTPGAGVLEQGRRHMSCMGKMHYFFTIFFFTPRHSKYIVMKTKEWSTKIVNFITIGVLC